MAWVGSARVQGLRPTLPPAWQPCSPGRGHSSSPGRGLGALELVPAAARGPPSAWEPCLAAVFPSELSGPLCQGLAPSSAFPVSLWLRGRAPGGL